MKPRKDLCATALNKKLRETYAEIEDHRPNEVDIPLEDALMSGLVMFLLKDSSLLRFDQRRQDGEERRNLERVYGIEEIPSDTRMREIIDEVDPEEIKKGFKVIFKEVQRGGLLKEYAYLEGHYLVSLDGTQYFKSKEISCPGCLERKHKNGEVSYSHQLMGAVIVHPDKAEVIPIGVEAIIKQDGETKNDCERNAGKRLLEDIRKSHPKLKVIILEDGLHSTGPNLRELEKQGMSYIIGAKQSDHKKLFEELETREKAGESHRHKVVEEQTGIEHDFHYSNDMAINGSNEDVRVNVLEYWEKREDKTQYFTWVTDIEINKENVEEIMRAGRSRWKIENETLNTLKNQGYNAEHNYGHGKKNLSVNFTILMMQAFLVDQVLQLACPVFKAAKAKCRTKKLLWERVRHLFYTLPFECMEDIYRAITHGFRVTSYEILWDTS